MNPVVAAGTLVEEDGRVVLVRRRAEPRAGYWGLPAGYVEVDESAEEAAVRETREEAGLEVELDNLLGVYSFGGEGIPRGVLILYAAHVVGGELRPGDDASEARFFAPAELPSEEEIAFWTHRNALRDWLRAHAVIIRPAEPEEQEDVIALCRRFHRPCPLGIEGSIPADNNLLVAVDRGAVVGYASVTVHSAGEVGRLDDVFVLPNHRRWGIGLRLVKASIDLGTKRYLRTLLTEVEATNEAMVVYLKAGFRVCGFLNRSTPHHLPDSGAVLFLAFDYPHPEQAVEK